MQRQHFFVIQDVLYLPVCELILTRLHVELIYFQSILMVSFESVHQDFRQLQIGEYNQKDFAFLDLDQEIWQDSMLN